MMMSQLVDAQVGRSDIHTKQEKSAQIIHQSDFYSFFSPQNVTIFFRKIFKKFR
jgi:hypothetical protein